MYSTPAAVDTDATSSTSCGAQPAVSPVMGITEVAVGITAFSTPSPPFHAITKQRFSDFIVHEVDLQGQVVQLKSLPEAPPPPAASAVSSAVSGCASSEASCSAEDAAAGQTQLASLVGESHALALVELHRRSAHRAPAGSGADESPIVLPKDDDKQHRTQVHRLIKQLLPGLLTDTVDAEGGGKSVRVQTQRSAEAHVRSLKRSAPGDGRWVAGPAKRPRVDRRTGGPRGGEQVPGLHAVQGEPRHARGPLDDRAQLRADANHFGIAGTKTSAASPRSVNAHKLHLGRLVRLMVKAAIWRLDRGRRPALRAGAAPPRTARRQPFHQRRAPASRADGRRQQQAQHLKAVDETAPAALRPALGRRCRLGARLHQLLGCAPAPPTAPTRARRRFLRSDFRQVHDLAVPHPHLSRPTSAAAYRHPPRPPHWPAPPLLPVRSGLGHRDLTVTLHPSTPPSTSPPSTLTLHPPPSTLTLTLTRIQGARDDPRAAPERA